MPRARLWLPLVLLGAAAPAATDRVGALLDGGWEEFRAGEYQRAEWRFADAAAAAPAGSSLQLAARYGLAESLGLRNAGDDPARAAELFESIVKAAPASDLAAWSLLGLARLLHAVPAGREPDLPKVRAAYQRVIAAFPSHPAGEEAFIYQQGTYVATLKPEDAAAALTALSGFIARHAASRFLSPAWALVAECRFTLKQPEQRLAAEIKALETTELDPTNPMMDHANAYWKIAGIAEFEAGDFSTARRFYRKLADEYPEDIRRFGALQALARLKAAEAGR